MLKTRKTFSVTTGCLFKPIIIISMSIYELIHWMNASYLFWQGLFSKELHSSNTFLVFFILYQSINASYERITRAPMFKIKHVLKLVSQKTALDRSYLALQWHWCFLKHRSFCMYPQWLSYLGTAQFRRITSTARWFLCLGFPNSQQMLIKVQRLQHAQTNWAINWNQHIAHQNIPGKKSNFASSL